ncbi:DUF2252 family protein [Rubrimonas sp.]|uniref:DUF2252 family protein n=1 Tax=Rubrimonas sp. TaxID=2036015 RepID=UPI003FA7776D
MKATGCGACNSRRPGATCAPLAAPGDAPRARRSLQSSRSASRLQGADESRPRVGDLPPRSATRIAAEGAAATALWRLFGGPSFALNQRGERGTRALWPKRSSRRAASRGEEHRCEQSVHRQGRAGVSPANVVRIEHLVPIRCGRMLQSPFAFFRGSAGVMAADLAGTPATGVPLQLCGDCELGASAASPRPSATSCALINISASDQRKRLPAGGRGARAPAIANGRFCVSHPQPLTGRKGAEAAGHGGATRRRALRMLKRRPPPPGQGRA